MISDETIKEIKKMVSAKGHSEDVLSKDILYIQKDNMFYKIEHLEGFPDSHLMIGKFKDVFNDDGVTARMIWSFFAEYDQKMFNYLIKKLNQNKVESVKTNSKEKSLTV